jgi:hypothetical protein
MGFRISLHGTNPEPLMSALGQKQTLRSEISMSALPPKGDIVHGGGNVRFVSKADSCSVQQLKDRYWLILVSS